MSWALQLPESEVIIWLLDYGKNTPKKQTLAVLMEEEGLSS